MGTIVPGGEDVKKAVTWITENLEQDPSQPLSTLIERAIFDFDLSPLDAEFLMRVFKKHPPK